MAALTFYLRRCEIKQCIAFAQWRYMFPPALRTAHNSPDKMRDNMKKLSAIFLSDIDISLRPTEKTQLLSSLTYDNEQKYEFAYTEQ